MTVSNLEWYEIEKLEWYDKNKLESYIVRYKDFKQRLENDVYTGRKETKVRNIVEGFEETYKRSSMLFKKVIQLTWLNEKESDDVICEALEITKQQLNKIKLKMLELFAKEMAYIY